jgi:hypothetical protein
MPIQWLLFKVLDLKVPHLVEVFLFSNNKFSTTVYVLIRNGSI